MSYCTKCGTQLLNGARFCTKCGAQLESLGYLVYEKFKNFTITDRSIILGNTEYTYSMMDNIILVNPPCGTIYGNAKTNIQGKEFTLSFKSSEQEHFMEIFDYANDQIDKVHGMNKKYKYMIQDISSVRVEIYDDFIVPYVLSVNVSSEFRNVIGDVHGGYAVRFSEIDIQNIEESLYICLYVSNVMVKICYTLDEKGKVLDIINYFEATKTMKKEDIIADRIDNSTWGAYKGVSREFYIGNQILTVPTEMDVYNTYRLRFRDLAIACSNSAKNEGMIKIKDLGSFLAYFPEIYETHLNLLVNKAVDILIDEGIWTVSQDTIKQEHSKNYHSALDAVELTLKSIDVIINNNQKSMANATSYIPRIGAVFTRGGVGNMLGAWGRMMAVNGIRDYAADKLINGAAKLNDAQQNELYNRINFNILYQNVMVDYWNVYNTLIYLLRKEGKVIWFVTNDNSNNEVDNIFKNLSNPNFPKDKKLEIFVQKILKSDPYKAEYQKFMLGEWGTNEETLAIYKYFGF